MERPVYKEEYRVKSFTREEDIENYLNNLLEDGYDVRHMVVKRNEYNFTLIIRLSRKIANVRYGGENAGS